MFTHNEQKSFNCNQCSYACTRADRLNKHMLIHSGEKPFSCNECSYKCGEASKLKCTGSPTLGRNICLQTEQLLLHTIWQSKETHGNPQWQSKQIRTTRQFEADALMLLFLHLPNRLKIVVGNIRP